MEDVIGYMLCSRVPPFEHGIALCNLYTKEYFMSEKHSAKNFIFERYSDLCL